MDGRRHSVDLPISRALVALRRVRSLRDPSTNSMSKLSSLVEDLNWETKSSNAITLGFGNVGSNDNNHELNYHSRFLGHNGSGELFQISPNIPLTESEYVGSEGSFSQPKRRLMLADNRYRGRSKHKNMIKKQNRLSRVTAGDALSPVVSPSLSVSDLSSCWSKTPRLRLSNPRPVVEEQPLLLPYLETPRSLCQKFMPKSFKELVGQNVVAMSLLSAISNGKIASLYLFHGPNGVGKTLSARLFAAALNCLSHEFDKPCGLCNECMLFFSGKSRDVTEVNSLEINSVNRLRSLLLSADVPPILSRFKVYIVDECHSLQRETWAAVLDKIEDFPGRVVFIMVTPDPDKVPLSAASKSQRYHFQTVRVADIADRLCWICEEEGIEFDKEALDCIAQKSNGSVRDAEMMLDQMSLLSKKITVSLVYEVNGVVSDDEMLDLLHLAFSSDASNMIKMARELTKTRIDPLQLISQLANLIVDILAGKCDGVSEIRRKLFGLHNCEADMERLRHALKILSETEKQLRTSNNQTTWLTAALLQLGSSGGSHDALNLQDGDFHGFSSSECSKHPITSSCGNIVRDNIETLELIWIRATGLCKFSSLKNFLQKRGKLASINLIQGVAVAELEFDHPDHVSKAEKSWKEIAAVLQLVLGYNVELRINLANNHSSKKYTKFKRPSFSLFSSSQRVHLKLNLCAECGSSASEYSGYTPKTVLTRDGYVETCCSDCGSNILHACCHGSEMVKSIRNCDGNALSIGVRTPNRSSLDSMERKDVVGADSFDEEINNGYLNSVKIKPEKQPRGREYWKLNCWRTIMFPFRKAQALLEKKLY